ncbi:MAG: hypothetical protein O3A51_09415 [Verrucomicrobia bacterium]|nr:hypothetical protein [Verrucomicrobiota bacterium]
MRDFLCISIVSTLLAVTATAEQPVAIGDSEADLFAAMGTPGRIIDTNEGRIFFFEATLVYVSNGRVDFVSVGDYNVSPPSRPLSTSVAMPFVAPRARILTAKERVLQQSKAERAALLAGRARKFTILQGFDTMRLEFAYTMPINDDEQNFMVRKDALANRIPSAGETLGQYWTDQTYRLAESIGGS